MLPSGKILQSRYQLQGLIESTVTFNLYIARDLHFSDKFWFIREIQSFPDDPFTSAILTKHFQEKSQYFSKLEHPGLAKIIDYFTEDRKNYFVMEYTSGQTLKQFFKNPNRASEDQALAIGTQLAEVIEYLHSLRPEPVLLLNLNPSHIYIHSSGILLVEYGFSTLLARSGKIQYLLEDGEGYCAPEILQAKVDNRTDVYSLGIILYQFLTGLDPKESVNLSSIRIKNPDVSTQLDNLIKKAIKDKSSERYPSVTHLKKEIIRIPGKKDGTRKTGKVQPTVEDACDYTIGSKLDALRKSQNVFKEDLYDDTGDTSSKLDALRKSQNVFKEDLYDDTGDASVDSLRKSQNVFKEDLYDDRNSISKHIDKVKSQMKSIVREKSDKVSLFENSIDFSRAGIFILVFLGIVILSISVLLAIRSFNLFSAVPEDNQHNEGENSYKIKGIEDYNNKHYVEAVENLTKALSVDPEDGLVSILLQNSYLYINGKPFYVIAVLAPLSGYSQKKGEELLRGVSLAQIKINEKEEIYGKGIMIRVEDDMSTISGAINAGTVVCNDNTISAVIGPLNSDQVKAVSPVFNEHKLVCIAPTASCPGVDELGPYIFRLSGTSELEAGALGKFCIEQAGFSRIAIMYDDTQAYSAGLAREFKDKATQLGATVTADKVFSSDKTDFKSELSEVIKSYPDVLFFSGYHKEAARCSLALRELGSNIQLIGGDALYTQELIDIGGKSVEGILFTNYFHPDYNNKTREFSKEFSDRFRVTPSARTALSYDSLMILARAINISGANSKSIRDYLLSLNKKAFEGITGKTFFDLHGNSCRDLFLITVKDGKFILVSRLNF
ncbi:MAG: ABC transporter substrate-binding protein [Candidatus Eremiobacterota bacterium]